MNYAAIGVMAAFFCAVVQYGYTFFNFTEKEGNCKMKKRIIGMFLSFTMLLTTINVALPLGVLAENEETSIPIVTETIETPEETTEYAPIGEASGEPVFRCHNWII